MNEQITTWLVGVVHGVLLVGLVASVVAAVQGSRSRR